MNETTTTSKASGENMEEQLSSFEARWKFLVFPAMIAFVILAGFGFYLIYGMLQRMEDLARDVERMADTVQQTMPAMQGGVISMSSKMQWIGDDLHKMTSVVSDTMPNMQQDVNRMSSNIDDMSYATASMANSTHSMGQNIWNMNRNVSKPLSIMRKMMPFGSTGGKSLPSRAPYAYKDGGYSPNHAYRTSNSGQSVQQSSSVPTQPAVAANSSAAVTSTASTEQTALIPQRRNNRHNIDTPAHLNEKEKAAYQAGAERFKGVCSSCHATNAKGGFGPAIAGRKASETEQILNEYRNGTRAGTMSGLVRTLSIADQKNIAIFLEHYKSP
ncbi:MAG: c-type cytochrome [bacterium]